MGVKIDGTNYNVRVVYQSLKRTFSIPQGGASGKSLAYSDIDDIYGTQYDYTIQVEPDETDMDSFYSFYEAITTPVGSHTVEFPYNNETLTFSAKITGGTDTYIGRKAGKNVWKTLALTFTATQPQRTV